MRKWVLVLLVLVPITAYGIEYVSELPGDGIYESINHTLVDNGIPVERNLLMRIGVMSENHQIAIAIDFDHDGEISDGEFSIVHAKFLSDGILWYEAGGIMMIFMYLPELCISRYVVIDGDDVITLDFVYTGEW